MKEIILNETPVRTSANFGINNIICLLYTSDAADEL